jgi:diguanylate cyclase (GGDEF)-like protein
MKIPSPNIKNVKQLVEAIGELAGRLDRVLQIENLIPGILDIALRFSGMDVAAIYLVTDELGGSLRLLGQDGMRPLKENRRKQQPAPEEIADRVFQTKQAFFLEDASKEAEQGARCKSLGMSSQASLPLLVGPRGVGVLEVYGQDSHRFTLRETSWLQILAAQIALWVSVALPETQSRAAALHLIRLRDFEAGLFEAASLPQVLDLMARVVMQSAGAQSATVCLVDSEGNFSPSYGIDSAGRALPEDRKSYPEEMMRRVSHAIQPLTWSADELSSCPGGPMLLEQGIATVVGLPLRGRSPAAGALMLQFDQEHFFQRAELEMLSLYSLQASGAIDRLHVMEEKRQREGDLRMVVDMTHTITSTLDLEELLQHVAVVLLWTAHMDACVISSVDEEQSSLHMLAAYNSFGERLENDFSNEGLLTVLPAVDAILHSNTAVLYRVDAPDCPPEEAVILRRLEYVAELMLPLWSGGKLMGLARLFSHQKDLAFSSVEMMRMRMPAEQTAMALANARLYGSEREQRLRAETMRDIGLVISGSLKTGTILDSLLKEIERVVPFDCANVMLLQGDRVRVASHRGYDRYGLTDWMNRFDMSLDQLYGIQHMAVTRRPFVISDVKTDPQWKPIGSVQHIGSWVGAPLVAHDLLLGFLSMEKAERGFYGPEYAARLEDLAGHAALALLNALTYGEVEQASITDFVTGVYNRRYFDEQLRLEVDRARRIGYPVSLLIADLDFFKHVNDTYGHSHGDCILQMVAHRIKDELRTVDILARYGGEEFAVILPGTPASSLMGVGERLRQAVTMQPFVVNQHRIPIAISIGGATFPDDVDTPQNLIDAADGWLYRAKATGRNRVRVSDPSHWQVTSGSTAR